MTSTPSISGRFAAARAGVSSARAPRAIETPPRVAAPRARAARPRFVAVARRAGESGDARRRRRVRVRAFKDYLDAEESGDGEKEEENTTAKEKDAAVAASEDATSSSNEADAADADAEEKKKPDDKKGKGKGGGLFGWLPFASVPSKAQEAHLAACRDAADAEPDNFVRQDALLRELVSAERYRDVVERFESRSHASGPGSVVAYLTSLGKLDLLDRFDMKTPPPAQLSMAAATVMKREKLTAEQAAEAVAEAVAIGAATKSELPTLLRDLSKRAEGRNGVIKVPRGASAAAPLHVVIGDGYGGSSFGPDGGGQRAKGNGVVNFIFYGVMACVLGSAGMSAMKTHAANVNKGGDASASASARGGASSSSSSSNSLMPGKPSLPALGGAGRAGGDDAQKKGEGSSFDPKEYNKDALPEKSVKTFKDVLGCDEAKEELQEIVEYLQEPRQVHAPRRQDPEAASCLAGPPGTGKTLLARAVAGEAGVPVLLPPRAPSSSRCSSASAPRACATSSRQAKQKRRASSSSTRSTPSGRRARRSRRSRARR